MKSTEGLSRWWETGCQCRSRRSASSLAPSEAFDRALGLVGQLLLVGKILWISRGWLGAHRHRRRLVVLVGALLRVLRELHHLLDVLFDCLGVRWLDAQLTQLVIGDDHRVRQQ